MVGATTMRTIHFLPVMRTVPLDIMYHLALCRNITVSCHVQLVNSGSLKRVTALVVKVSSMGVIAVRVESLLAHIKIV